MIRGTTIRPEHLPKSLVAKGADVETMTLDGDHELPTEPVQRVLERPLRRP
jgi:hypothetical protein